MTLIPEGGWGSNGMLDAMAYAALPSGCENPPAYSTY